MAPFIKFTTGSGDQQEKCLVNASYVGSAKYNEKEQTLELRLALFGPSVFNLKGDEALAAFHLLHDLK